MSRFRLHPAALEAADRPWTPAKRRRADGELRLFTDDRAERLTTSPPWWPVAVLLLPTVAATLWLPFVAGVRVFGWLTLGIVVWTLFEYVLHRWILHWPGESLGHRVAALFLHGHHHVAPNDPRRLVALPAQALLAAALFAGVFHLTIGPGIGWMAALAGWAWGYLAYEWIHWSAHHRTPRTAWGRALRAHHLRHHFEDHESRFGISSPLWDVVFRTLPDADGRSKAARHPGDAEEQV